MNELITLLVAVLTVSGCASGSGRSKAAASGDSSELAAADAPGSALDNSAFASKSAEMEPTGFSEAKPTGAVEAESTKKSDAKPAETNGAKQASNDAKQSKYNEAKPAKGIPFGGIITIDKTIFDWGDVSTEDGPLDCSFEVTNTSPAPVTITSVVSSCGCTGVEWTREAIQSGAKGIIKASYSNDEGAYAFDKTLTVYFDTAKKPLILHLRGVVHQGEVTLENSFPERLGDLGFTALSIKAGNMSQGEVKSAYIRIANFSNSRKSVSLRSLSPQLEFGAGQISIEARGKGQISYTVSSDRSLWGRNTYEAEVLEDGRPTGHISLWAVTKEDFSSLTREEKKAGPTLSLEDNTFTFDPQPKGKSIEAVFRYSPTGDFKIYKIDLGTTAASVKSIKDGEIRISVDSNALESGEQTILATLYTNSPLRPIVNLFITGFIY